MKKLIEMQLKNSGNVNFRLNVFGRYSNRGYFCIHMKLIFMSYYLILKIEVNKLDHKIHI